MANKFFTDNLTVAGASTPQQPLSQNKQVRFTFTGNPTGAVGTIQVSNDGTNYVNLLGIREDNGAGFTSSISTGGFSVIANISGWSYYRVNVTVLSTGTLTIRADEGNYSLPQGVAPISLSFASSVVTSSSANALAAGANGATNPAFNVDASAGSAATGLNVAAAAAAAGVALSVISSVRNEALKVDAKGTGTITLASVSTGAVKVSSLLTVTSVNANGLAVGANGTTNPVLKVDCSTASVATGLSVTGAAAAGGLALAVISSGTNEALTVNAKGSGAITIGGTSTGIVSIGRGSVNVAVFSSTKTSLATQNTTPTAAQLLTGYIQHASVTGAGTATLDTAANIDAAIPGVATGDSFECVYSNTGSQTVTITTATGLTLKGTVAIPAGKVAELFFFRTGSAAWDVAIVVSA